MRGSPAVHTLLSLMSPCWGQLQGVGDRQPHLPAPPLRASGQPSRDLYNVLCAEMDTAPPPRRATLESGAPLLRSCRQILGDPGERENSPINQGDVLLATGFIPTVWLVPEEKFWKRGKRINSHQLPGNVNKAQGGGRQTPPLPSPQKTTTSCLRSRREEQFTFSQRPATWQPSKSKRNLEA